MKIIEAVRDGELSYVKAHHAGVSVEMQKAGQLVSITKKGRGNIRFAKSQAKAIHRLMNG